MTSPGTDKHTPVEPVMAPQVSMEKCASCKGRGIVAIPDLQGVSMAAIARGAGRSPALLSRMFTDDKTQKRPNPTLETMQAICAYIEKITGEPFSLDQLAGAIQK